MATALRLSTICPTDPTESSRDTDGDYESNEASSHLFVFLSVYTYLAPVLVLCGGLGNISALLVLLRPCFNGHSMSLYLSVFAGANTVYLFAGFGLEWLSQAAALPLVAHLADWTCRVWRFAFEVVRHLPDWLLVAAVADRLVATRPSLAFHRAAYCKRFVAKVVVVGVSVGVTSVGIHAMWTYGKTETGDCEIDQRDFEAASVAWPLFSAVTLSYVPKLILLVTTPLLATEFLLQLRRRKTTTTTTTHSASEESGDSTVQTSYTACCVCSAVCFLVCTVPPDLVNVYWYASPPEDVEAWQLSVVVCSMVTCFQSGTTFVWYFVCIGKVRLEFAAAFRRILKCRNSETLIAIEAFRLCAEPSEIVQL